MANVYFGDGITCGTDWNTVANWYSSKAGCCCGITTPGTPLGRLPTTGDVVYLVGKTSSPVGIVSVPSNGFTGPIHTLYSNQCYLNIGTQTLVNDVHLNGLSAFPTQATGKFSGTIYFEGDAVTSSTTGYTGGVGGYIGAGTFTGSFVAAHTGAASSTRLWGWLIQGGTYAPTVSIPYSAFPNSTGSYLPWNPGFGMFSMGGTFSPVINLTGVPAGSDILGAGLP